MKAINTKNKYLSLLLIFSSLHLFISANLLDFSAF